MQEMWINKNDPAVQLISLTAYTPLDSHHQILSYVTQEQQLTSLCFSFIYYFLDFLPHGPTLSQKL